MEKAPIIVDPRHTMRSMRSSMQGDVVKAIVELITNCDDSYTRQEEDGITTKGAIEITFGKPDECGVLSIKDFAEGMNFVTMKNCFSHYGGATSGLKTGKSVRGYFGQGAKDALINMQKGKICSFKDGKFCECSIFAENNAPMYEISEVRDANTMLRRLHSIDTNGTVAYFTVDPNVTGRVPRYESLYEKLSNNYIIRRLIQKRHVRMTNSDTGSSRRLRYQDPKGDPLTDETFIINHPPYGDFKVHFKLLRSRMGELTQDGDDRSGGLLIMEDGGSVLAISLFRYDTEPLAARFFGEVVIDRFRVLLEQEEPVLTDERDGLAAKHPFCQKLIAEIEKRIHDKIETERTRKENTGTVDREEATRFRRAFSILNDIAQMEVPAIATNLGQSYSDDEVDPLNGFALLPSVFTCTVGKKHPVRLALNTKIVHHGTTIKISSSSTKIRVTPEEITLTKDDGKGIISKHLTVEGL